MKKLTIILLLTLMLSVCMLMGQITITYDDMPLFHFLLFKIPHRHGVLIFLIMELIKRESL